MCGIDENETQQKKKMKEKKMKEKKIPRLFRIPGQGPHLWREHHEPALALGLALDCVRAERAEPHPHAANVAHGRAGEQRRSVPRHCRARVGCNLLCPRIILHKNRIDPFERTSGEVGRGQGG
jgi:hypothetical protein